ncbi:bestrophin family protein [Flavisolibacter nicotianae]|uniref:bestrophin family protein n=1 Tax=Flavisolibacter nicotianae TaxID=2364882 RepID=UPI000EACFD66|nr:bestrophin family ion channel [Flavisolibacter nicotianae]
MIVREKGNWFRMLFIWRGSVLVKIYPRLLVLFLMSSVVVYSHGNFFSYKIPLNSAPFTLMGLALAIFLGFYNNASYDRYWEGRKLWGALLNDTRSLARQALTMGKPQQNPEEHRNFIHLLIAFTHSLKHQLRRTDPLPDLKRLLPPSQVQTLEPAIYKPMTILLMLGNWVNEKVQKGEIDTITQAAFDRNFNQLSDIVGGCERIASTPIPFTYSVLLHRTVYLYCFLLPFGLVDSIGWMTPVIVVFIGYTFMALDAVVGEIEEPFGNQPNDLALNTMSHMIETTLLEMAQEPLPESLPRKNKHIVD